MAWFKVDDGFYDHPKVLGVDMSALGLWTLAGSYCARHLTDGVISDRQIRAIGGTRKQAEKLVAVGLWRSDGAPVSVRRFFFNDWSDFQPSRDEVTSRRREDADRKREARAAKAAEHRKRRSVQADVRAESERMGSVASERSPLYPTRPDPTRPDPSLLVSVKEEGYVGSREAHELPSPRCPQHVNDPTDRPCRPCGEARVQRKALDAEQRRAAQAKAQQQIQAEAKQLRAQIDSCELCDSDGYAGTKPCSHDPDEDARRQRGIAEAKAALRKDGAA